MSQNISRRKFLTYMLGATGAFMAASVGLPLVRFATDALVKKNKSDDAYINTGLLETEITETPMRLKVQFNRDDAWRSQVPSENDVFVFICPKKKDILVLSPKCTHLGCLVNYEEGLNQFKCPCHMGLYDRCGKNIPGTPPPKPLMYYPNKVESGRLFIQMVSKDQ